MSNEAEAVRTDPYFSGADGGKMKRRQTVSLRPHHGLCLRFFEGYGYSDDFNKNMAAVLNHLEADSPVRIAEGHDSICKNCPNRDTGCPNAAIYDKRVLALCGLRTGEQLSWSEFQRKICTGVLDPGRLAEVCGNCRWYDICGKK